MLDGYAVLGGPGEGLGPAGPLEPCRSTTPTSVAAVGAEPGSARRSRTPSRTPQSAAKNAALAAQLQVGASVGSAICVKLDCAACDLISFVSVVRQFWICSLSCL